MPPRPNDVPSYRRHKSTNQAVCTIRLANGKRKDLYLGPWKSAASKAEYARLVSLVSVHGGIYPSAADDLTVSEALVRYTRHVGSYYRDPSGTLSTIVVKIKWVLGYLRRLYGPTPLADFGPPELKAIRTTMIGEGRARKSINKAAVLVRQFFRWCVEEQLVEPTVLEVLRAVQPLSPGRSGAPEGTPREPADPTAVEKTLPLLTPGVRAIVQLLRLTGARPSEVVALRPCDLNRGGPVWAFTLPAHKTAWKGKARVVHFGPEAQGVLAPWLADVGPDEYVFSPRRSEEARNALRSEARQTPRWPSHMVRNERKRVARRGRPPSHRYTATAVSRAVQRACERAEVTPWTPYQLRHLRAVELRERYGLETVRAVLGQSFMAMSDHYSKAADATLAGKAAAEIG
jgi:integrase